MESDMLNPDVDAESTSTSPDSPLISSFAAFSVTLTSTESRTPNPVPSGPEGTQPVETVLVPVAVNPSACIASALMLGALICRNESGGRDMDLALASPTCTTATFAVSEPVGLGTGRVRPSAGRLVVRATDFSETCLAITDSTSTSRIGEGVN